MGDSTEINTEAIIHGNNKLEVTSMNSEDETATRDTTKRKKKRVQCLSDSESDKENSKHNDNLDNSNIGNKEAVVSDKSSHDSSSGDESIFVTKIKKSAMKNNSKITDSDSNDESNKMVNKNKFKSKSRIKYRSSDSSDSETGDTSVKNVEQQIRMKNKRSKLKDKFKSLISSREHNDDDKNISKSGSEELDHEKSNNSTDSNDEMSSIENIKQKIKERNNSYKTTICDPDTSDEETKSPKPIQKKSVKSTKLISPKPIRMTAKQAMENMKMIKSESNRMLREKEVSLPYHRPKALSLKDIMSRRKPAVSSDGKSLPIKMNEEQLKQYAQLLEQRQKEMMELCKSDTDDEEHTENTTNTDKLEETKISSCVNGVTNNLTDNVDEDMKENTDHSETVTKSDTKEQCSNVDENMKPSTDNSGITNETDPMEDCSNILTEGRQEIITDDLDNSKESETEVPLVYNDSLEEPAVNAVETDEINDTDAISNPIEKKDDMSTEMKANTNTELDSQSVFLHYDTEKTDGFDNVEISNKIVQPSTSKENTEVENMQIDGEEENNFSDNDINFDEIDNLIENAEIYGDVKDENVNSPMLMKDTPLLNVKPKLMGAPGMVIDLDGSDPAAPRKLSGVELLKERFTYFSRLKTPEEMEREKEKRMKPGTQHLKLKQELEEQIAEQRSLEWAKRLEEEKQQQMEMDVLKGDASYDDIEKIEAKLADEKEINEVSSESEEEEEEEELGDVIEKARKRNPMIDDEAEESDVDECEEAEDKIDNKLEHQEPDEAFNDASDEDSSDDESSESEVETEAPKKGRILKAFEDSDDEESPKPVFNEISKESDSEVTAKSKASQATLESQDDDLQLAQRHKSFSEDLFTSQESGLLGDSNTKNKVTDEESDLGTQTFSILNNDLDTPSIAEMQDVSDKLNVICETQNVEASLDDVVGMCSGGFTQNLVTSQFPLPHSQSQAIGQDILEMCTGKFYDSKFVSQLDKDDNLTGETSEALTKEVPTTSRLEDEETVEPNVSQTVVNSQPNLLEEIVQDVNAKSVNSAINNVNEKKVNEDANLKSILDELNDPEFEAPKPNKFFVGTQNKDEQSNTQFKKKFIIDSDDESNDVDPAENKPKKKYKKKKAEKRALQISDDEEENSEEEQSDPVSDVEDEERMVEYDSEENEVELIPQKAKKKRKTTEFFEQEAELTSEDEWVGSGDEDEAGLDRMEREEGDDDQFNQRKLQRELEQIHMRDVLDQDKREVRIIQELLFEDGDLGDGHRQRKFRWKNADGEEETGTVPDEFADTQEEEFESEEQWRKQRHEREVFLRQMQQQDKIDDSPNVSINRTTIIKANLCSRTMSSILSQEANKTVLSNPDSEKKIAKESIASPKKAFTVFKQSYHGSLLSRGRGALARLAALATPLAVDDDAPKIGSLAPSSKRNFVFAALTPEEKPKVTKRKAETNVGTPRLVKKMKSEETRRFTKNSLLDHMKA